MNKTKTTYIYALCDKKHVKYIGKSDNPKKRLAEHICESKKYSKTHKHRWIRSMIKDGKEIEIKILEIVPDSKWKEREIYWIKEYRKNEPKRKDLTNDQNGGCGGQRKRNWLSFEKAKKIVHNLKLKSAYEWKEYCKSGKKQKNIPNFPEGPYKKHWKGYGDWLGTGRIATQNRKYLPFEEAKNHIQSLKLKNVEEWFLYCKSGKKPNSIPTCPEKVYKNDGWLSMIDWLGKKTFIDKIKLSFEEVREFIHKLNLKTYDEWKLYCESKDKPNFVPTNPQKIYKNNGWISYIDWINSKPYIDFEKAKKYTHSLKLKTNRDWRNIIKHELLPKNIPTSPSTFYKKEWISWYDWLGTK